MYELISKLVQSSPVILDGAWGTQLQTMGLKPGECPDSWNLLYPNTVSAVACSYTASGSQVILTNTFGANRIALSKHGLAKKAPDINWRGAEISKRAAVGKALVFGSIGPTGKLLIMEEVMEDELREAFSEQAFALSMGGADALVIETMSDLSEAIIAVECAVKTGLPVVACMTFDSGRERDRTLMGITPEQAAAALTDAGASVIGANCGQGIEEYLPIVKKLRAATDLPLWVKPNAGMPQLKDGALIYQPIPKCFSECAVKLVEAGANFIGGCCGTDQTFIRALARVLKKVEAA